jgi:CheY-like chemotaxis protein
MVDELVRVGVVERLPNGTYKVLTRAYVPQSLHPDALERFRQSPDFFDVVISDHTMPHMTAYQLAKEMLKINASTRIILCTGYSDTITAGKVSAVGIRALLYKPIRRNELAQTIRDVLTDHSEMSIA